MKTTIQTTSRFLAIGATAAALGVLALPGVLQASPSANPVMAPLADTEDVVYLKDGRELRGQIIEESRFIVRFKVINRELNVSTEITISRDQIYKIEKNVPIEETESTSETTPTKASPKEGASDEEAFDPDVPGLYVVPIKGQLGTDVYYTVYEPIIEDIKARQPACVIFEIDCNGLDRETFDVADFEELRKLVHSFKDELSGIRQVVWIDDSIGMSSVVALAWKDIYMKPEARLDGLYTIHLQTQGWKDDDIRAKMQAAWSGIVKGFIEFGGHDLAVAQAMMFPWESLSATFKGREVEWALDANGEVIVDNTEEFTAGFLAEDARNLLISKETVEELGDDDLADLAFILGYREYRKVDGIAEETIDDYIKDWRKTLKMALRFFDEFQASYDRIGGDDAMQNIGKSRKAIEKVLAAIKKYYAVERMLAMRGITKRKLLTTLEQLREQAREIRNQERERRGGGGGGGRPPGIPGGGGG